MVRTIPHRQTSSKAERIGASKKNIDAKKNSGHINSDRTTSQKTAFWRPVGCPPNMRAANPLLFDLSVIVKILFWVQR